MGSATPAAPPRGEGRVRRPRLDGLADGLVDKPDDRGVVGRRPEVDDLGGLVGLIRGGLDDVAEARQARDHRVDVLVRRDRLADLVAGHDRDVVDRDDIRRVCHRDQQGPLVDEPDRQRLVALGRSDIDEVGGRHVDAEHAQVDEVEPIALGHGPRGCIGSKRRQRGTRRHGWRPARRDRRRRPVAAPATGEAAREGTARTAEVAQRSVCCPPLVLVGV